MRFKDKVVLVTGGAQGLGEAICRKFAAEGARVVVTDVNYEGAQKTAGAIAEEFGVGTIGIGMNVCDEEQVEGAMELVVKTFGRLDVLISNAGILKAMPIDEFSVSDWRKVIEVNLVGYMVCAKHAARVMTKQQSGVIIQINSKSGKKGSAKNSAYAASKFGGIGLTQSLALELAPQKIRVNAVCPGNLLEGTLWKDSLFDQYSKTQGLTIDQVKEKYLSQVPLGRACEYDDVTNVVAFLASDEASYMTGQALNVTGGQEMN